MRERADVRVEQETLSILEQSVCVFEIGLALADGLDLGPAQGDSGFEFVGQGVVVAGRAIVGGVAHAGGDGVAVLLLHHWLGLGGDGRIGQRSGHKDLRRVGLFEPSLAQVWRGGSESPVYMMVPLVLPGSGANV